MADQPQLSLVELTKFAGYLLIQIEAHEALLIQKGLATKEDVQTAIEKAERSMGQHLEIDSQDAASLEPAIADTLRRLKARAADRLR